MARAPGGASCGWSGSTRRRLPASTSGFAPAHCSGASRGSLVRLRVERPGCTSRRQHRDQRWPSRPRAQSRLADGESRVRRACERRPRMSTPTRVPRRARGRSPVDADAIAGKADAIASRLCRYERHSFQSSKCAADASRAAPQRFARIAGRRGWCAARAGSQIRGQGRATGQGAAAPDAADCNRRRAAPRGTTGWTLR
jgi:hypothetical protein